MEWKNYFDANVHAFICVAVHRCVCMWLLTQSFVVETVIVCPCTNSLSANSLPYFHSTCTSRSQPLRHMLHFISIRLSEFPHSIPSSSPNAVLFLQASLVAHGNGILAVAPGDGLLGVAELHATFAVLGASERGRRSSWEPSTLSRTRLLTAVYDPVDLYTVGSCLLMLTATNFGTNINASSCNHSLCRPSLEFSTPNMFCSPVMGF